MFPGSTAENELILIFKVCLFMFFSPLEHRNNFAMFFIWIWAYNLFENVAAGVKFN